MRRVSAIIVGALASLAGCAGLLGFEDIVVVGTLEGAVPDATAVDVGEARTDGGASCRPDGEIKREVALSSLADPDGSEVRPRLTRDELTIVFDRLVEPGKSLLTRPFIARRNRITEPFAPAAALLTRLTAVAQSPAPNAGGTRFYFSQETGSGRVLRTVEGDVEMPTSLDAPGGSDTVYPFYSEATSELFFSRSDDEKTYALFRMPGLGATFGPPERIESIDGADAGGTSFVEPVLSHDGLRLYYATGGVVGAVAFVATRADRDSKFASPEAVRTIDVSKGRLGWISADECRVYTYRFVDGRHRLFQLERDPE